MDYEFLSFVLWDLNFLSFELWGLNIELYDMNYEFLEWHELFSNKDSRN